MLISRLLRRDQQGGSGHELAGLAEPALRNCFGEPGLLQLVRACVGQPLDRGDLAACSRRYRRCTRSHRLSTDVDGACATQADAAAPLGSGEAQQIAQNPDERHVRLGLDTLFDAVDGECIYHSLLLTVIVCCRAHGRARRRSRMSHGAVVLEYAGCQPIVAAAPAANKLIL